MAAFERGAEGAGGGTSPLSGGLDAALVEGGAGGACIRGKRLEARGKR